MNLLFTARGWADYLHWVETDKAKLRRLDTLLREAQRSPFEGIGKPEALKGNLAGWWSRRIDDEHRLVYRLAGTEGQDQRIEIIACRYHY